MRISYASFLLAICTSSLCLGCKGKPPSGPTQHELTLYKMPATQKPSNVVTSIPVSITSNVQVVDLIPPPYSYETNQDSEPNISVSSLHADHLAASAFTPGPFDQASKFCPDSLSPVFVSSDSGVSWSLNCIVPTYPSTFDITLRYGPISDDLYASVLLNNSSQLEVLRETSTAASTPMEVLLTRTPFDQPYLETARLNGGESVLVGENNCCGMPAAVGGRSASVDISLNPGAVHPTFLKTVLEQRETYGDDLASVRVAVHEADSTVYALFSGLTGLSDDQSTYLTSLSIVRDDRGGTSSPPFQALKDASDGKVGRLIAKNVSMPDGYLGNQRLSSQSHCSIAADPRQIPNYPVYVAWVDSDGSGLPSLHVSVSLDKGLNWFSRSVDAGGKSAIPNATNPALAVNQDGVVALIYQQLTSGMWETHIILSADGFGTKSDIVLSRFPDAEVARQFDPFIGDYLHLLALGRDFYGIFSASNKPDYTHFPFVSTYGKDKLIYQRDVDFEKGLLLDRANNIANVAPSIDPFFVKVTLQAPQSRLP